MVSDVLGSYGAKELKSLASEYHIVRNLAPSDISGPRFIRWSIPIGHSWPCNPRKIDDFVEKAAGGLFKRFKEHEFQTVLVGLLDPSAKDQHYRRTSVGLRGRLLQLLGRGSGMKLKADEQAPEKATLFCMIGDGGLYAGISTPKEANGFHPGGSRFISQKAPHMISRAGAKVAEALHYLRLHQAIPPGGAHWLELGACPGGMTSELLHRSYQVTALDRSPLDQRLDHQPGLTFVKADVSKYQLPEGTNFDALLCDMNGKADFALDQTIRFSRHLRPGGLVIFTLKSTGISGHEDLVNHFDRAKQQAREGGLEMITNTHLTSNRHEFTLFFNRA